MAQTVKNHLPGRRPPFDFWVGKIQWRRDRLPTPVFLAFHCGSSGKEFIYNMGDLGLIHALGRSPRQGKGYPLQYSYLENFMDSIAHGVAKSWQWLSDFHFYFCRDFCLNIYLVESSWKQTMILFNTLIKTLVTSVY